MEDKSLIFSYEYTEPTTSEKPTNEQLVDMLEELYELQKMGSTSNIA
jgi:hypothetical protein